MTSWKIEGQEFVNCNCNYACGCQFAERPTHGDCKAIGTFRIDRGHHGDTRLDGLHAAAVYRWPGAIHEGNGEMQLVIDERADADQRRALETIMTGGDTEEAATMWWIFHAMCPTRHETLYKPFEVEIDVDGRTARARVPGVFEAEGRPIRHPVHGGDHRIRIDLPSGFEYAIAEIGSGTSRTEGPIALELDDSYGQFARLHLSNEGVIREAA